MNNISGWWCNVPILKNHGVKVNGKDDIPYMKWKIKHVPNHQPVMCLRQVYVCIHVIDIKDMCVDFMTTQHFFLGTC